MSKAIEKLETAQKRAMAIRPKVGGFPYLAEVLRQAGVKRNLWFLPSCQSLYLMNDGSVVIQGTPLVTGTVDVPKFDRDGLNSGRTCKSGDATRFFCRPQRRRGAARSPEITRATNRRDD